MELFVEVFLQTVDLGSGMIHDLPTRYIGLSSSRSGQKDSFHASMTKECMKNREKISRFRQYPHV